MNRILKHTGAVVLEGALIASLVVVLAASTAFAGRGGKPGGGGGSTGGTGGTISLQLMNGDTSAQYGHTVTFSVATTATPYPYVHLRCNVGGTLVLESWQGYFATAIGNEWFHLGPTNSWTGGAADCTANLEKTTTKGAWTVLAATSFHVDQ